MEKLSALIITHNEEDNIRRCLDSVAWADEIVVIDSGSTDKTPEICKEQNQSWSSKLKFYERKWTGFTDQRNYSLDQASHDWVFVIDSDEKCSTDLKEKIVSLLSSPSHQAYKVKRVEYFLGKPIRYGIWNPSYQDRLFNKKGVRYTNNIHEYPVFKVPPQNIHEAIEHKPSFLPDQFLDKMNRYTTIEAQDRVRNGQRTNVFRIFFAFPSMFLKNYFYYQAYKDGMHGFIISLLEGVSRLVRHIKIWQFQNQNLNQIEKK